MKISPIQNFSLQEDYLPTNTSNKLEKDLTTYENKLSDSFVVIPTIIDDCSNKEQYSSWFSAITNQLNTLCNATFDVAKKIVETNYPNSVQKPTTLADQNTTRAKELRLQIASKLEALDASICRITGSHISPVDGGKIDSVELSTWDSLHNFSSRAQGAVTAIFDTTVGVATGAAIGGVATTGVLGVGFGVAALSGGTILALRNLRQFPENANNRAVVNEINRLLPSIQKDLESLTSLITQEQYRHQVGQRIMATTAMRYDLCVAMNQMINNLEAESDARTEKYLKLAKNPNASENQVVLSEISAKELQKNDPTQNVFAQHLESARNSLYNLIVPLIQLLSTISAYIYSIPQIYKSNPESLSEKEFKKTYATMLLDLADSKNNMLHPSASMAAYRAMKKADSGTRTTSSAILNDMKIGQNLFNTILSSEPNFGVIKYSISEGQQTRNYAVPSNLTTVRAIANYIDGQVISNSKDITSQISSISKGEDGTYTVVDPDHKLYNFFAGASNAKLNFVEVSQSNLLDLVNQGVGQMMITDYSNTFPGGNNQMVFEAKTDDAGNSVLTLKFSKQSEDLIDTHYKVVTTSVINDIHEKLVMQEKSDGVQDLSGMSRFEIWEILDKINVACEQQKKLLEEDNRQMIALNQWENPIYSKLN